MSKRSFLAKTMQGFGVTRLLEFYRGRPGILIINHHRIGDANASPFDRAVFSSTREQLDEQLKYIKRHFAIVAGAELERIISTKKSIDRLYVAVTFDDGYLDNYSNAFEVFKDNGCAGIFFLVPEYVGSNMIPWWDEIAYLVRNSWRPIISLRIPELLSISLDGDREAAILRVLKHYKRPDNTMTDAFMAELRSETDCTVPAVRRRFLSWDEAATMQRAGMEIGSHTMTHRVLSQLSDTEQAEELARSKSLMEEKLGCSVSSLAYPVGTRTSFTETTQCLARSAGYHACYSFFGGVNTVRNLEPSNLLRTSLEPD